MAKHVSSIGRPCTNCKQYVMIHELRNHGTECIYCRPKPPETVEGYGILGTEQNLAIKENRRREQEAKHRRL
jgi:hypothetical protein